MERSVRSWRSEEMANMSVWAKFTHDGDAKWQARKMMLIEPFKE